MTNMRFPISIWWPIMQNKSLLSFQVIPLPLENLVKLAFLNSFQQKIETVITIVLYCIVYKFLKWPKYKPQGPLGIDIISSRLLSRKR